MLKGNAVLNINLASSLLKQRISSSVTVSMYEPNIYIYEGMILNTMIKTLIIINHALTDCFLTFR